jgi:hypothetical protein
MKQLFKGTTTNLSDVCLYVPNYFVTGDKFKQIRFQFCPKEKFVIFSVEHEDCLL